MYIGVTLNNRLVIRAGYELVAQKRSSPPQKVATAASFSELHARSPSKEGAAISTKIGGSSTIEELSEGPGDRTAVPVAPLEQRSRLAAGCSS